VDKRVTVAGAETSVRYRLAAPAGAPLAGRWAVQWNLTLSAGDAPGRYFTLPDRPSLGSTGRVADVTRVALVDEWLGLEAHLAWSPAATLAWAPVETVSVSEGGFERLYQGTALLVAWSLAGTTQEISMTLTMVER
jgi:4-alpha-glucanotransferase